MNRSNINVTVRRGRHAAGFFAVVSRFLRCLGEHGTDDTPRPLASAFRTLQSLVAIMFLVGLLFGELLATPHTLEIVVWHDITSQFAPP
jgi:hypothetical protein